MEKARVDTSRIINRRALLYFTLVLAIFFIGVESIVLYKQRVFLTEEINRELKVQLDLLGEAAVELLLRSDYASVERLVHNWAKGHRDIIAVDATTPNGFVLATFKRDGDWQAPIRLSTDITFDGDRLLILAATMDHSRITKDFTTIFYLYSSVAIVFIFFLGSMLWWTLKRTAIIPFENEIKKHLQTEQTLLQRTAELETANQELHAFSYSVSHDLRTPLRGIDGFSHALEKDYGDKLDETAKSYLARVRTATQHMGQIIDGLLFLSQVTRQELKKESVDLSQMAKDISHELQANDPDRQHEFVIAPHILAHGDFGLLKVVMINLLGNAWKYTSKHPKAIIEFGLINQDGEAIYYVRDDGAGFDMRYVHKLFSAFQRLHAPSEFPGTGIGLATVGRIIRRHGGRIWAEAEIEKGAAFYFTLAKYGEASKV